MWRVKTGSKYGSRKVVVEGIEFDSKKEANRYRELRVLQAAGRISDLQLQVPFELIPAQREPDTYGVRGGLRRGKLLEHSVVYYADFVYIDEHGNKIVEDAKGVKTDVYRIKKKLMLYVHGIKIKEV